MTAGWWPARFRCRDGDLRWTSWSGLTPDQQFQAGLFCGSARATPTAPLPVDLPPAGTVRIHSGQAFRRLERRTTTRIRRASLRAISSTSRSGDDNLFHGERYKWSLQLTAINLTNKVALYNFLSTFSGTHYVTPRALTAETGIPLLN